MPMSFSVLIGFQLLGEIVQRLFHLPLPGAVIGMFLLTATLIRQPPTAVLAHTADGLIAHMGVLFVPAGVGIITQGDLLRHQWPAVAAGLAGSTLLSLLVTGLVFHHLAPAPPASAPAPALPAQQPMRAGESS